MLFDHLSGKQGRRSSQVGELFVLLLLSFAQWCFIDSSSIRLRWQREILDDLRSQDVEADKQTKAATTKHTENLAGRTICVSCRMPEFPHARPKDAARESGTEAPSGVACRVGAGITPDAPHGPVRD